MPVLAESIGVKLARAEAVERIRDIAVLIDPKGTNTLAVEGKNIRTSELLRCSTFSDTKHVLLNNFDTPQGQSDLSVRRRPQQAIVFDSG